MTLHRSQEEHEASFFRQLVEGAFEMLLELAGNSQILDGGRCGAAIGLRPLRLTNFTPFGRADAVERKPKGDAHEPGAEAACVAQPVKASISAEESVLSDVFGIVAIAQDAAGHAEGQWAAFREALLEIVAPGRFGRFAKQFALCRTTWLDQNQLLHEGFRCEPGTLALPVRLPDGTAKRLVRSTSQRDVSDWEAGFRTEFRSGILPEEEWARLPATAAVKATPDNEDNHPQVIDKKDLTFELDA